MSCDAMILLLNQIFENVPRVLMLKWRIKKTITSKIKITGHGSVMKTETSTNKYWKIKFSLTYGTYMLLLIQEFLKEIQGPLELTGSEKLKQ